MTDMDLDTLIVTAIDRLHAVGAPTEACAVEDAWAELHRLRGQTCETCRHRHVDRGVHVCGRTAAITSKHTIWVRCDYLGNGCRAHEPKESA